MGNAAAAKARKHNACRSTDNKSDSGVPNLWPYIPGSEVAQADGKEPKRDEEDEPEDGESSDDLAYNPRFHLRLAGMAKANAVERRQVLCGKVLM